MGLQALPGYEENKDIHPGIITPGRYRLRSAGSGVQPLYVQHPDI